MTPAKRARLVHRQIDQFLREGLISASTHAAIARRYPLSRWDWRQLSRWFTIFGGLSTAIGASIFLSEVISLTLETLAVVLVVAAMCRGGDCVRRMASPRGGKRAFSYVSRVSSPKLVIKQGSTEQGPPIARLLR